MKKILIFLAIVLVIALGIALGISYNTHVQNEEKEALRQAIAEEMMQHCDKATEKLLSFEDLYTVHSIDYSIVSVEEKEGGYKSFNINMEWYVEADEFVNVETDRDYWATKIRTTDPHILFVDDEMYTIYTNITLYYNDERILASIIQQEQTNTNTGYSEARCTHCGTSFRANSTYGRRAQKGMPCGFRGCK